MVWGLFWLSRAPAPGPSSGLLRLRMRLLSMEAMLEEEVVRERPRRVIPADGTERGIWRGKERERGREGRRGKVTEREGRERERQQHEQKGQQEIRQGRRKKRERQIKKRCRKGDPLTFSRKS